jgi:hypothetical protein
VTHYIVLLQIKRWAVEKRGWAITSLYMSASNFVAAPTGSSTIMRFLAPRSPSSLQQAAAPSGQPVPEVMDSGSSRHTVQQKTAVLMQQRGCTEELRGAGGRDRDRDTSAFPQLSDYGQVLPGSHDPARMASEGGCLILV